jgi:hypothetical protein
MQAPRGVVVAVISIGLLASCTTDDGGGGVTPSGAPTGSPGHGSGAGATFSRHDLDAIVLMPSDAPKGTEYASAVSGFQNLEAFAADADEAAALREDGFVVGHLALFAPEGHAEPGQGSPLPLDAPFAQEITGLFGSGDGASDALHRFTARVRTQQMVSATSPEALAFGDESFAIEGDVDGSHVVLYAWRDGNLVLAVSGVGSLPPETLRSLADLVQDRATS